MSSFLFVTGKGLEWSQGSPSLCAETTWWSIRLLSFFPYCT